jgi:hypothetical protein
LDSIFLKNHGLMDYSLLLTIENVEINKKYLDTEMKRSSLFEKISANSYRPSDAYTSENPHDENTQDENSKDTSEMKAEQ